MSGTVRAEVTARLMEAIAALGGSAARMLATAGLTAEDLTDPERPIAIDAVMRLADAAARELGDDCLGLHAGARIQLDALGPLTYAVLNAPTVGAALRNLERYGRAHFRGPRPRFAVDGDEARLALVVDVAPDVPRRHHAEACAVVGVRLLRRLLGPGWRPRRIGFGHARPSDVAEHERIFAAPLRFRQPVHCELVFAAADLDRAVPDADRRLLPIVERHLQELLARPDGAEAWLDDVRAAIGSCVCDGRPGIGIVAARLGLSVRTLQRRLTERGVVFKALVEDVRRQLALRYVADSRTSLTDVAFLLGYSELSAFGRAFRRWTGSSPLAMRRSLTPSRGPRVHALP